MEVFIFLIININNFLTLEKCDSIQIQYEISRFEGDPIKVFPDEEEEEAPLSPVISKKDMKKVGKMKSVPDGSSKSIIDTSSKNMVELRLDNLPE